MNKVYIYVSKKQVFHDSYAIYMYIYTHMRNFTCCSLDISGTFVSVGILRGLDRSHITQSIQFSVTFIGLHSEGEMKGKRRNHTVLYIKLIMNRCSCVCVCGDWQQFIRSWVHRLRLLFFRAVFREVNWNFSIHSDNNRQFRLVAITPIPIL